RLLNIFVDVLTLGSGDLCLSRVLNDASNCRIVEATADSVGVGCSSPGRAAVCSPSLVNSAATRLRAANVCGTPTAPTPDCASIELCELAEADASCLTTTPNPTSVGWCYVDPSQGLGDPSLVASCQPN